MSTHEIPDVPVWTAALEIMRGDDRITPQLEGFLNLAVAQGVMGGTLYLDVPNELTAAQINKRMRAPILEALAHAEDGSGGGGARPRRRLLQGSTAQHALQPPSPRLAARGAHPAPDAMDTILMFLAHKMRRRPLRQL